jgi:hypothetical protein
MLSLMMAFEGPPELPPRVCHNRRRGFRAIPGTSGFSPYILASASRRRLCAQSDGLLDKALLADAQLAGRAVENVDRSFVNAGGEYSVHGSPVLT